MKQKKCKIQIGAKFGKLKIVSRAESWHDPTKSKKTVHRWNCICDCGKETIVMGPYLLRGRRKDCGCGYDATPKNNLKVGDKFNRLTLVKYYKGEWECKCDCGKKVTLGTYQITGSNTKSCGCLNREKRVEKGLLMQKARRKFDPEKASARRIWKQYCYRDGYMDITFEDFLTISKQNCHYCGLEPQRSFNCYGDRGSDKSKTDGYYLFNGLDRIDSSKYHTKDNVVASCYDCNRYKNNLTIDNFLNKINKLQINNFIPLQIVELDLPESSSQAATVNYIFYNYREDTDLNIKEFYWLSQQPCYYCGEERVNKINPYISDNRISQATKDKAWLEYNGIDRIDSSKNHNKDNIVPCCKYCNFGKGNMSLNDFNCWINRIQAYRANLANLSANLEIWLT